VLEVSSGQTRAPSEVLIEEARQGIPATEEIKACHPPEPAVLVEAAQVAVEAVVAVVVAAGAGDSRPGITQPLLNGGKSHGAAHQ